MRRIQCLRCLLLWLLTNFIFLPAHFSIAQEQDERLTAAPPDFVRCYGRVVDSDSTPVIGAQVTLVAPYGGVYFPANSILANPATLTTMTQMDGSFSLQFASDDKRFFGSTPFLMLIQADGFATQAFELKVSRLLVNLPLEKTLAHCEEPLQLKVGDAEGKPIAGAKVRAARLYGRLLPFKLEENPVAVTDVEGQVVLSGCSLESLESIYVESQQQGNQILPVVRNETGFQAAMMQIGIANGQIELPEDADPSLLEGQKVLVVSTQGHVFSTKGPNSLGWQQVAVDRHGQFVADRLAVGSLRFRLMDDTDLNFVQAREDQYRVVELLPGSSPLEWKIPFQHSSEIVLTFLDEDGNPLPNLDMGFSQDVSKTTDEQGRYPFKHPRGEKPEGSLFPGDTFGRVSLEPFGIILERHKIKDGQPEPIRLPWSRALVGRVIDAKGNSVAGAKVEFNWGEERFNRTDDTVSDNSGRFELRGLPPRAAVEIKASKGNAMTDPSATMSIVAGSNEEVTLVLIEQAVAAPVGRVVDAAGQPIANAKVSLSQVVTMQKEGYGNEECTGQPWSTELPFVLTDAGGRFQYPDTPRFAERMEVSIAAEGFLPFKAPFVSGIKKEVIAGELRLGDFQMIPVPRSVKANVRCVDAVSGNPIADAELVFIGARAGRTSGKTDLQGTAVLTLKDTPQIAAVRAKGYSMFYESFGNISESMEFKLQPDSSEKAMTRLVWFDRTERDYLDIAKQLFQSLEMPGPTDSTFYRHSLYFSSLATVDLEQFARVLSDPQCAYEEHQTLLLLQLEGIWKRSPSKALELVTQTNLSGYQKVRILGAIAESTNDQEMKDEIYGEAIVALGAISGSDVLTGSGFLARHMIADNRIEAAMAIMQNAWDSAEEFRSLVQEGKPKLAIGESRYFATSLAIIEPETALKLIDLTATQNEIKWLKDQALGALSLCDWDKFRQTCEQHQWKYEGGASDWFIASQQSANLDSLEAQRRAQWAGKVVDILDDSVNRLSLALFAARHLPPGPERERLIEIAVRAWEVCEVEMWYHWSDPAKFALEQIRLFDSIEVHELDQLVFACLNKTPESFSTMNLMGVLGDAARLLSIRDAKLGRDLLEPAFDETVWLFDHVGRTWFDQNIALCSCVWVDPAWAAELAQQLSDRYSEGDPIRKAQMFSSIISEIGKVMPAKR